MKQILFRLTLLLTIAIVSSNNLVGQKSFQLVPNNEITDGNYIIVGFITEDNSTKYYAMGNTKSIDEKKYKRAVAIPSPQNDIITTELASSEENESLPFSFKIKKTESNNYTIFDNVQKKYITPGMSGSTIGLSDNPEEFSIYEKNGFLKIEYSQNTELTLYYIKGNYSTTLYFRCGLADEHILLYKEVTTYNYSRNITSTNIGTICLPYSFDVSENTEAKFYEIAGKTTENDNTVLVFNQVDELEAGIPYIFKPESGTTSLSFDYTGIANPETTAGNKNGLYGTFADISDIKTTIENTIEKEVYLVKNNIIQRCGIKNILYANRAYIVMSEVPIYDTSKSQAKAILRVPIDDSSTGIEEVAGSEVHPMEYHSVNGMKLSAPQKGLNIVKMNDGSTQKVFVP